MNFIYLNSGETTPNNIRLRTVVSDSQSIAPAVGSLAFTAWIASLAFTLGLQLVGYAPTLSQGTPLTPTAGALSLTGQASPIGVGLLPSAGALSLTGSSSTVSVSVASNTTIGTTVGSLLFSGAAPTVTSTSGGISTSLKQRVIRGNDATGKDDWWISYQA